MCSQEEVAYISEGFNQNLRSDGRQTEELRSLVLETGQLVQASGSARLKLGDTDVLVAVKVKVHCTQKLLVWCTDCRAAQVELGTPTLDRPDCGNIFFAVECSPCASPRFQVRLSPNNLSVLANSACLQSTAQPYNVCTSPHSFVQGRGGDDLAAEYAKTLERSMYTGPSGIGNNGVATLVQQQAGS